MKKILFMLISMFLLLNVVNAETYVTSYYTLTNKCAVVKDNKAVIPVAVKSNSNNLKLSKLIKEHRIDYIDNLDSLKLEIYGVNKDNINVYVDYLKNSEDKSYIIFTVPKDMELDRHEELVSFNIGVEILDDALIKKIDVLGNEVILSDEKTCEVINGFKINEVEKIKYVDLSKVDHTEYFEDLFTRVIIGILGIALIVCIILLIRKKK